MKKFIVNMALMILCVGAHADPILVVSPSESDTTVGSQVTIDVSITNLTGQFIGDYDLSLAFDDSILSFTDVLFGPFLDGPGDSIQGFFENPGSIDIFEISLFFLLNQDGFSDFSLFTLNFDVISAGTTALDLSVFAIGDFFGDPLNVGIENSSLMVARPVAVPEPGTLVLFGFGLFILAMSRMRLRPIAIKGF